MIKKLLSYTLSFLFPERRKPTISHNGISRPFPKRALLTILFFVIVFKGISQAVDNWYAADRAINTPSLPGQLSLFTPYAPADGTPVNVWYELVDFFPAFTQNAMEHPDPLNYDQPWENYPNHGFELPVAPGFLTPTGAIPGVPTLHRNVMNFNPAIHFDGAGEGDALYFRSHAHDERTVFIVFAAPGAGNSAETQSLLFGGDIDSHLNGRTNLSLGVSDGNVFSVGRTYSGDGGTGFFQPGSINLLERPTVATFSRVYSAVEQETLRTRVNGLPDINIARNHGTATQPLFYYNRMGKHFNDSDPLVGMDPSNLTGHIAEIFLVNGIADADHIRRVESYLAIKYGITLNETGVLGSVGGNIDYDYLAADGTTIWTADVTGTYIYDIAGIGKDRFRDPPVGPGHRMRYNLHQRISKSVNTEARVTISTNSNFTTDNLDDTRTAIDASPFTDPREHNYIIWGNDHGSMMATNVELPADPTITERISREWKVQVTKSAAADPILGVSVRVELNGSDIDLCELYLMIDTDGDGDFTTESITSPVLYIPATSIVGTDAFFDNIDFEDEYVFTIGYGDTEDPTASNPTPMNVCDAIPAQDPSVVTDEADNCAVDTVTHLGDSAPVGSDPAVITRTYRITDTSGNFVDVVQTINLYTSLDAGTNNIVNICVDDPSVNLFASLGGTPDNGGMWNDDDMAMVSLLDPTNVDFTGVLPGIYNFTYTVAPSNPSSPCPNVSATVTLTIVDEPTVAVAGFDIAQCNNGDFTMAANIPTIGTGTWTEVGPPSGITITNVNDPSTTVTGLALGSSATLRWTISNGVCPNSFDDVGIVNNPPPLANAGSDEEICQGGILDLSSSAIPPNTSNFSSLSWNSGGDGSFSDTGILSPTYTPGATDIANGFVTLTLTANGNAPCLPDQDQMILTITTAPIVDAGTNGEICEGETFGLSAANPSVSNHTSLSWTSSGDGSFDDNTALEPIYTPGPGDIGNLVTLTLTATGNGSCSNVSDFLQLTVTSRPTVSAGSPEEICQGDNLDLSSSAVLPTANNFSTLSWTTAGDGSFDDIAILTPIYTPGATDIANGSVTLTLIANGNGSCASANSDVTLTITASPTVDAGSDEEICEGNAFDLSISSVAPSAANYGAIKWESSGTGNFSDDSQLTTMYTPSIADILAGSVTLTLRANGNGSCMPVQDQMTLTITPLPMVNAGSDQEICEGNAFDLSSSLTQPNAINFSTALWASSGDGSFDDATALMPIYTPGLTDITNGTVVLTVSAIGNGSCTSPIQDSMTLTIDAQPTVALGPDDQTCGLTPYTVAGAVASNYESLTWMHDGNGSFTDATILNVEYVPDVMDIGNVVTLTLTVGSMGVCSSAMDELDLMIEVRPQIALDGFSNPIVCGGNGTIDLTFTNVPDGDYTINYDGGSFANVLVTGGNTTINAPQGIYNNLSIIVNGCTSAETDNPSVTLTDPGAPIVDAHEPDATNNFEVCGLTHIVDAQAAVGTGTWTQESGPGTLTFATNANDPDQTFTVDAYGTYTFRWTDVNGTCSGSDDITVEFFEQSLADAPSDIDNCGPYQLPVLANGDYFDAPGGLGNMLSAGDFINVSTTIYVFSPANGSCPAVDNPFDINITLIPTIAINGFTDPSTCGGNNGEIVFDFTNVADGLYNIDHDGGSFNNVNVNGNQATISSLTADTYTNLSLTIGGCTSSEFPDVMLSDPTTPTITVDGTTDPTNCGDNGQLQLGFTNVPDGNYTIDYDGGSFANVNVMAGVATIDALQGNYDNLTITINACTSAMGMNATLTDPLPPSAPNASSQIFCTSDNPTGASLIPAISPSITWYSDNALTSVVDPGDALLSQDYYLTQTTNNCEGPSTTISVTITDAPDAGMDSAVDVCNSGMTTVDLFGTLGGTPDIGGNWNDDDGSGVSLADPLNVDFNGIAAGAYDFTYTVSAAGCADATAVVTVTVNDAPDAGMDGTADICGSGMTTVDLFGTLGGTPDGGGNWNDDDGSGVNLVDPTNVDFNGIGSGIYEFTYTVSTVGCTDATAVITVTVNNAPTIVINGFSDPTICSGDNGSITLDLTGVPDGNHTIHYDGGSFPNILIIGNFVTINNLVAGSYNNLRIMVNGCISLEDPDVTLSDPSPPSLDSIDDVEACDSYLLPAITGTSLTGNEAYFDAPNGGGNQYLPGDPITASTTLYTYDQNGTCSDQQDFDITINTTPLADAPGDVEACDSYILPALTNGDYFDAPNGMGNILSAGDQITSTTTLYVFTSGNGMCPDVENSFDVTIYDAALADTRPNVEACDSYILPVLTNGSYFDGPGGTGNVFNAGDVITTSTTLYVFSPSNGSCPDVENSFQITISNTPLADDLSDVNSCGPYQLPMLINGSYYDAPGGAGTLLSAGDFINTSTTLYVFSPANGTCPAVDNPFTVTIDALSISSEITHESCWESGDGSIDITIETGVGPYTIQLDAAPTEISPNNTFTISGLPSGNYTLSITDTNGCQTISEFEILPGGPDLDAIIEAVYSCESGVPSNSVAVRLNNPSISQEVLYALDSTNPEDYILDLDFGNIPAGEHFLSILHINGCLATLPFTIEDTSPLGLNLTNSNMNEITANAFGGSPPYIYFFNEEPGTSNNTFTINRNGTFTVRVLDGNGCETIEIITLNYTDIEIPTFFTPNNDGQNDFWGPRNIDGLPNIKTAIFDRYGREIKIMGQLDNGWDGLYESRPMPSGDYWYIIRLNDNSEREFVGHFTLYR